MSRSNWKLKKHAPRTEPANPFTCGKPIRAEKAATGVELRISAAGSTATITAAEGEGDAAKLGTFAGNAYTGAAMRPEGWWRPIVVDLAGVRASSQHRPVLRQHDHNQIVGHTESVKVTDKGIEIAGVLSGEKQHTDKVTVPAKNGFRWQLSIGATPVRTEELEPGKTAEVNGREVTGPLTISRETDLGEISFVPLGADGDTSATVTASKGKHLMFKAALLLAKCQGNVKAAKYSDDEIDKMSDDEAKAALKKCMADDAPPEKKDDADAKAKAKAAEDEKAKAADDEGDEDKKAEARAAARIQATRKAEGDESRRCDAIRAHAKKYGVETITVDGKSVNFAAHAIEAGWDSRDAELAAMRNARPNDAGPRFYSPTTPEVTAAVLECAVFDALPDFKLFDSDFYAKGETGQRRTSVREEKKITAELNTRYPDQVRQAAHTHFRGRIGLQQLLTILASANGYRGPATFNDPSGWGEVAAHLGGAGFRADAASTVNAPATLSNVQNKFVLQGYLYTEQAWQDFCSVLPVKDLKPTKSVQLFGDFMFKGLNPGGEMQHASVGDNPYANQAALQARMITLELQYLINDDLGMFGQLPMMLGRGWGLRINDLVYTKFNSPGFDEGGSTNFFAATHTNGTQSGNSNYQSGAGTALSSSSLKDATVLFNKQVDPAGVPLGVDPEILLYPPELDVTAIELMNAQFIVMAGLASTAAASKQPNTNIWKGRFKPVMSRYLSNSSYTGYSATAWYLLANPGVVPVIQIAALNGQLTPTIQTAGQDWQFNMLGMSMRGWGGVGVAMQNYRGGVKSAGA